MTPIPDTALTGAAAPTLTALVPVLPAHPSGMAGTVAFQEALNAVADVGPLPAFADGVIPALAETVFVRGSSGQGAITTTLLHEPGAIAASDQPEPESRLEAELAEQEAALPGILHAAVPQVPTPPVETGRGIVDVSVGGAVGVSTPGVRVLDSPERLPDAVSQVLTPPDGNGGALVDISDGVSGRSVKALDGPEMPSAPMASPLQVRNGAPEPAAVSAFDAPNPIMAPPPLSATPPPEGVAGAPPSRGDKALASSPDAPSDTQAEFAPHDVRMRGEPRSSPPDMPPASPLPEAPGIAAPSSYVSPAGAEGVLPTDGPPTWSPPAAGPIGHGGRATPPSIAVPMPPQSAPPPVLVMLDGSGPRPGPVPETGPDLGAKAAADTGLAAATTGTRPISPEIPALTAMAAPPALGVSWPRAEVGREPDPPPPEAPPPAAGAETPALGIAVSVPPIVPIAGPQADATRPPGMAGLAPPAVHDVGQRITTLLRDPGTGTIALRLNPKELGSVTITLQPVAEGMVVLLQAERPETADLMRRHTDLLLQEMRHAGFAQTAVQVPATAAAESSSSQTGSLMSGQGGGFAGGSGGGDQPAAQGMRRPDPDTLPAAPHRAPPQQAGTPSATGRLNLRL